MRHESSQLEGETIVLKAQEKIDGETAHLSVVVLGIFRRGGTKSERNTIPGD